MHPSFNAKFRFNLNKQLNTYIGKIYTSTNTTPIHRHTGLLTAAETVYSILDTFVQDLLSALQRLRNVWKESFLTGGLLTSGHHSRVNNACIPETQYEDAERFGICVLITGQSYYTDCK